ncbi:Recd-like DNA helicase YrrC [Lentilactobacillus kosonis]|uniref:Recd-like DNA helicase YrrC n=1 Tax=Lentilactobacillus kosonis TaxID=2810561 RepID=A0A401FPE7_9LACO|nr:Recd-like DNA helicase YrrC [Lentilactobacillus kosonis]
MWKNGDTYTTTGPLLSETTRLLEANGQPQISADKIAAGLVELAKSNQIIGESDRIFPANLYRAEFQIAEHLQRVIENNDEVSFTDAQIEKQLRKVERKYQISYDQSQTNAITDAIKSPVFVLTGGPGTGKTTIINGIVNTFCELNDYSMDINQYKDKPFPVILAAPTGRAAKHMTDSTGLPASTIHRLLGLNRSDSEQAAATKDIDGELLIIDEMSMVDTYLFKMLVSSVPNHMKIILVGDQDQLPSVGPGQVFHDLLTAKAVPYMKLDTIYRQDANSSIISLAHEIHQGELPVDFTVNQRDRSFIPCDENQIASVVQQVTERAKSKGFSKMDVQVLAPMYRGRAGIDKLNDTIQEVWQAAGSTKSVTIRQHTYRIGDKVLQLENNPEKNVFNGDIGMIVSMKQAKDEDTPSQITIDYDDIEVTYQKTNGSNLPWLIVLLSIKLKVVSFKW